MAHTQAILYVHASDDATCILGQQLGLSGEAFDLFVHAACEVKLLLDVNLETGEAVIVAVDDRDVA